MSNEMIERVARAICEARGENPDEVCEDWMKDFSGWRGYTDSARAAIKAVHDSADWLVHYQGTNGKRYWATGSAWLYPGQAIAVIEVDAALREGGT